MHLNTLAGRSYNDLMQYPVFPWIIADYDSPVSHTVLKYYRIGNNNSTVEPPLVDKGHNRNDLSIKDASQGPKCSLSHSTNTFSTSEERTTSLLRTKWLASQRVLYSEVPLYLQLQEILSHPQNV